MNIEWDSYNPIIAHERNKIVLIEFGRYIQALVVLLVPSFKYSGVSKIVYFTISKDIYWLGCEDGILAFLHPVYLLRMWLIVLVTLNICTQLLKHNILKFC